MQKVAAHYSPLKFFKTASCVSLLLPLLSIQAEASGFAVHEQGATGSGTALAGVAAASDDISLSYWNPALLTNTHKTSLYINGTYVTPDFNMSNVSGTDATTVYTSDKKGSDPGQDKFAPSIYFATPLNEKTVIALSLNIPFAVSTEYDDDWAGRYYSTQTDVKDIALAFSGAYRLTQTIDFGASVQLHHTSLNLKTAINDLDGSATYGTGEIDLDDSLSYGYSLGIRAKPRESTAFGIGYRSKVKVEHSGDATFNDISVTAQSAPYNISNTSASANNTLPDILTLSLNQDISPNLIFGLTAMRTGWHSIQTLEIEFDNEQSDSVIPLNYRDSWLYSLGLTYHYSPKLTLRGGYAQDQAPAKAENTSPIAPESDRQWITLGGHYLISPNSQIVFSFTHLKSDALNVYRDGQDEDQGKGEFSGDYQLKANSVSLALNIMY